MAVYKDKRNNSYYVKYRSNGVSNTKRGFKTKLEAQKYDVEMRLSKESATNIRFQELVEDYLTYIRQNHEYGTYQKYSNFLLHIVVPNFSNKFINKITDNDCYRFRECVQGLPYSTSYKNAIMGSLKAVFNHAVKYYSLDRNPCAYLDRFSMNRRELMTNKEREMNIWSDEEFSRFISCVHNDVYKALFITLYYTGMRKGEVLALSWHDIKDHTISVNKSLTRKTDKGYYEIKDPKNYFSIREVSLNNSLYEYLMNYKAQEMKIAGFSDDWFVFGRDRPIAENTLTRVKNRSCDEADLKRIRIHDFRHSHASNLIGNGVNIVAVSKRLGHSSINMTLKKYTHLISKNDDELIKNLELCSHNVLTNSKSPIN